MGDGELTVPEPPAPPDPAPPVAEVAPAPVVSPFARKNYVSHTKADFTAILKLIEMRFGLPSLTKRDAAQMDMTEFFDFVDVPWWTPPTPPPQFVDRPCYLNQLP